MYIILNQGTYRWTTLTPRAWFASYSLAKTVQFQYAVYHSKLWVWCWDWVVMQEHHSFIHSFICIHLETDLLCCPGWPGTPGFKQSSTWASQISGNTGTHHYVQLRTLIYIVQNIFIYHTRAPFSPLAPGNPGNPVEPYNNKSK